MTTQIFVDAKLVRSAGPRSPKVGPIVVRTEGVRRNAYEVVAHGPVRFVANMDKPLIMDGDRAIHVWAETEAEVKIVS